VVTLVGWHVAGFWGMLVTSLAKFGPSSIITIIMLHVWERFKDKPWRRHVQAGLLPVTGGLVAASALLITQASITHGFLAAITAATAIIALKTKIHPLWLLFGGALAGFFYLGTF